MAAHSIQQAEIAGDLLFGHRFSAEGTVSLTRTPIGGDLDFVRATFENSTDDETGNAIDARRIEVAGEVRPSLSESGVPAATIGGRVDFAGARIRLELRAKLKRSLIEFTIHYFQRRYGSEK